MERGFHSFLREGANDFTPLFNLNNDYMSFQSLLSLNHEKALLDSLELPYDSSKPTETASYRAFSGDFNALQKTELVESPVNGEHSDQKLKSVDFKPDTYGVFTGDFCTLQNTANSEYADQKHKFVDMKTEANQTLKMPKEEPYPAVPFNFIGSRTSDPVPNLYYSPSFIQLPELQSLEQVEQQFALAESSSSRKRAKSEITDDPYILESIITIFNNSVTPKIPIRAPAKLQATEQAKIRRTTVSEKNRSLQKLLPWDKKMDTATMYEEAYKYIKFLQAQVSVLHSMPRISEKFASGNPSYVDVFAGLGRLNRQQLLEILVNSPVAQTILYSKGCCVYSIEQLMILKKIAEKKCLMFNPLFS